MEATATVSSTEPSTGSSTVADLIPRAAAEHAEHTAVRFKRGGAWHDVSYAELATIVQEVGLGLIDLGIEPGERVCILANTRPEWSYADLGATAAGAVVVPIYQTNSPEECLWVISDSGAERDRLRGRGAAREDRRDPRPAAGPAHGDRDRSGGSRASLRGFHRRRPGRRRGRAAGDHARSGPRARALALFGGARRAPRRPYAPRTRTRSSTPPARPARRRAACSRTATTGRSST